MGAAAAAGAGEKNPEPVKKRTGSAAQFLRYRTPLQLE